MEPTKQYYSLREVTETTGLPASTLRYWEKQFDALSPRKDAHGNRYYTQADIDTINRIKYIRDDLHITRIDAIATELKQGTRQTDVKQRATEILLRVQSELSALRDLI